MSVELNSYQNMFSGIMTQVNLVYLRSYLVLMDFIHEVKDYSSQDVKEVWFSGTHSDV